MEYLSEIYLLRSIYGDIFSLGPKEKIPFSYFSFPFYYCQLLCRPVGVKQSSIYNVSTVVLVGILKETSRDGNPLNGYLSVQKDLFFDAKISCSKVNKGHLLSKHAILDVGLLIVLIKRALLS